MPVDSFDELAVRVRESAPRLGRVRLVVVDGPAGSGKTTFAGSLSRRLGAAVVHLDDLYEGWSGLAAAVWDRLHDGVLAPLAQGRPGRYRRYDWAAAAFAEWREVPLAPVLVVEGVGAAAGRVDPFASLRVWVEADEDLRLERGAARDGAELRHEWVRWLALESEHFAFDGTRSRADLVVDGRGREDGDPTTYVVLEDRRRS